MHTDRPTKSPAGTFCQGVLELTLLLMNKTGRNYVGYSSTITAGSIFNKAFNAPGIMMDSSMPLRNFDIIP